MQEGAAAEDAEAGGGSSSRPAMPKMSFNKATFATEGSDQVCVLQSYIGTFRALVKRLDCNVCLRLIAHPSAL